MSLIYKEFDKQDNFHHEHGYYPNLIFFLIVGMSCGCKEILTEPFLFSVSLQRSLQDE